MLLLQQALQDDEGKPDTVFLPPGASLGVGQWFLSPGPVDLGEGTQLVLPQTLVAHSIGIGVIDGERDVYGPAPFLQQVTVTAVIGISDQSSWFEGKDVSRRIATIEDAVYPPEVTTDIDAVALEHCNIHPGPEDTDYILPDAPKRTVLEGIRPVRGELFIPATEDDLYVFWRSFVMQLRVVEP